MKAKGDTPVLGGEIARVHGWSCAFSSSGGTSYPRATLFRECVIGGCRWRERVSSPWLSLYKQRFPLHALLPFAAACLFLFEPLACMHARPLLFRSFPPICMHVYVYGIANWLLF